jgi:hypothetical protein
MPSKKRNKGRKTKAKSKSSKKGAVSGAKASYELEVQLQQLQLSDSRQLPVANDIVNNSQCKHGLMALPDGHICQQIIDMLTQTLELVSDNADIALVLGALQSSSTAHPKEWEDAHKLECMKMFFVSRGAELILDGEDGVATAAVAFIVSMIEQRRSCRVLRTQATPKPNKFIELANGDPRTLISFFKKKIPCKCLDEKYNEVKYLEKTGICANDECSLPNGGRVVRSTMLTCSCCRETHYCSRECAAVHWQDHKQLCRAICMMKDM